MEMAQDDPETAEALSRTEEAMENAPAWFKQDYQSHESSDLNQPTAFIMSWVKAWPYGSEGVKPVADALFKCLRAAVDGKEKAFDIAMVTVVSTLYNWRDDLFGQGEK